MVDDSDSNGDNDPGQGQDQPEDSAQEEAQSVQPSKRRRVARAKSYPTTPLQSVVALAEAIRDNSRGRNAGRIALAQALDVGPASSRLRVLISDSAEYGLTSGNYNSETIALTDLGLSYVRPRDDEERQEALRTAALRPSLFARLYKALDQAKWPSDTNVQNLLIRDFQVPQEYAEEASTVARANAAFVGLLQSTKRGSWLTLNADLRKRADDAIADEDAEVDEETSGSPTDAPVAAAPAVQVSAPPAVLQPAASAAPEASRDNVFISHSKNPQILEQIKTILDFGQFISVVAEEEETAAIPVPDKVLSAMRRCRAGVINVSADESERRDGGTYGINQNVLIEIGVAFALYDRRVVLVVDKRVQLPSNLQGLYRCEYEGDELGWTAGMKLQRALANFRER